MGSDHPQGRRQEGTPGATFSNPQHHRHVVAEEKVPVAKGLCRAHQMPHGPADTSRLSLGDVTRSGRSIGIEHVPT